MKKQYMNYGSIQNANQYTSVTSLKQVDYSKKGQVYQLTHGGEGESLSFMNKAFISFTYGGRKIEDFSLVAITVDRLDRETPPSHEDYVTQYKMLNGQYYWGSHYQARELIITLATDGMTQEQLDDFKSWFQAGEIRELILAQHPNRGILARIAEAPQISVIPFSRKIKKVINKETKDINVIEYKGNISIHFVMDEPFWYAIKNVFGKIVDDENGYSHLVNIGEDVEGNIIDQLNQDNYKSIAEDHIPAGEMIKSGVSLGDGTRIVPYDEYKYTLTNDTVEARNDQNRLIPGTPVVNSLAVGTIHQQSGDYPLSGGIIGPLYISPIQGEKEITELNHLWYRKKTEINLYGEVVSSASQNCISVIQYLPVKAGSTIEPIVSKLYNSTVKIFLYDIVDYVLISSQVISSTFTCPADCYIRFQVTLDDLCESYGLNDYFIFNILTFEVTGEGLESSDFGDTITKIEEDWLLIGYNLNSFDGVSLAYAESEKDNAIVKKLLPVKRGSSLIVKEGALVDIYFYNINDGSFDHADISIAGTYVIGEDSYIRLSFYMSDATIEKINDSIQLHLVTYSKNPIALNYFYSGTAPSYPTIEFSVPIHFNAEGYIDSFNNKYILDGNNNPYNTLTLESQSKRELKLTTPNVFTAYNKVIEILSDDKNLGLSLPLLKQLLRLSITHPIIRNWVINCINIYEHTYNAQSNINDSNKLTTLTYDMRYMILLYMPYVFDTFANAKINERSTDPIEEEQVLKLVVDYDELLLKQLNADYTLNADIGETNVTLALSTLNALFYQWQVSIDGTNWFPLDESENWSGTTTSTLVCAVLSSNDCDKFYRCRVSNYQSVIDTQPIKIQAKDTELYFLSIPDDEVKNLGDKVSFSWKAKNYDTDNISILYKLPNSQNWVTLSKYDTIDDSIYWPKLETEGLGTITFSFIIQRGALNGCMFRLKIQNAEHPEGLISGTQQAGVKITVLETQMNTTLSYQISNDGTNWYNTSDNYIIKDTYIRVQASNIQNATSTVFLAKLQNVTGARQEDVTSSSSIFYQRHKPIIETSVVNNVTKIYLIWKSSLEDENFQIVATSYGVNTQSVTSRPISVKKIVEEDSAEIPILPVSYYSIYSSNNSFLTNPNNLEAIVGNNVQITAIESNSRIQYQWYFQKQGEITWHQLPYQNITGSTSRALYLYNITEFHAGKYRVKLYRSGVDVTPYDDEQIYVTMHVKPAIQIIEQPVTPDSITYYEDNYCEIILSCTAKNATHCIWYYQMNSMPVAFGGNQSIIEELDNGNLRSTILINNFKYSQLKSIRFYCRWMNDYTSYYVQSLQVQQPVIKTDYTNVNFTSIENKTLFTWKWPVIAVSNTDKRRTGYVECYCSSSNGKTWEFYGMPPTEAFDKIIDKVEDINTIGGIMYQSQSQIPEKKIASISVTSATKSKRYSLLQLTANIQEASTITGVFKLKLICKYYNKSNNLLFTSDTFTNFDSPITILSQTQNSNYFTNIRRIDIYVRPYYTKPWSGPQAAAINNLPDISNYSSGNTWANIDTLFNQHCQTWMGLNNSSNYRLNLTMQGKIINWTVPQDELPSEDDEDDDTEMGESDPIGGGSAGSLRDEILQALKQKLSGNSSNNDNDYPVLRARVTPTVLDRRIITINYALSNPTRPININSFGVDQPKITFLSFVKYFSDKIKEYTFTYKKKPNSSELAWQFNNQYYDTIPGLTINCSYAIDPVTSEKIYYDIGEGTIMTVYVSAEVSNVFSLSAHFKFDNMEGKYKIRYNYNKILWPNALLQRLNYTNQICYLSSLRKKQSYVMEEDAGDMILYNNFIFTEQNHFKQDTGTLQRWTQQDKTLCHKVTYDGVIPLQYFQLYYKNYYL